MTLARSTDPDQKGMLELDLTGAASSANAGLGAFANPEGCSLLVTRVFAYFATGSTGAANLDIGITTVAAKGIDIAAAMDMVEATVGGKAFSLPVAQAAETEVAPVIWASGTYLTATGSATSVGLAAKLYVEYIRL